MVYGVVILKFKNNNKHGKNDIVVQMIRLLKFYFLT